MHAKWHDFIKYCGQFHPHWNSRCPRQASTMMSWQHIGLEEAMNIPERPCFDPECWSSGWNQRACGAEGPPPGSPGSPGCQGSGLSTALSGKVKNCWSERIISLPGIRQMNDWKLCFSDVIEKCIDHALKAKLKWMAFHLTCSSFQSFGLVFKIDTNLYFALTVVDDVLDWLKFFCRIFTWSSIIISFLHLCVATPCWYIQLGPKQCTCKKETLVYIQLYSKKLSLEPWEWYLEHRLKIYFHHCKYKIVMKYTR